MATRITWFEPLDAAVTRFSATADGTLFKNFKQDGVPRLVSLSRGKGGPYGLSCVV